MAMTEATIEPMLMSPTSFGDQPIDIKVVAYVSDWNMTPERAADVIKITNRSAGEVRLIAICIHVVKIRRNGCGRDVDQGFSSFVYGRSSVSASSSALYSALTSSRCSCARSSETIWVTPNSFVMTT